MSRESTRVWRKMDSAPKDGTRVLLWHKDGSQQIGSYTHTQRFVNGELVFEIAEWNREGVMFWGESEEPLFWQPLPGEPLVEAFQPHFDEVTRLADDLERQAAETEQGTCPDLPAGSPPSEGPSQPHKSQVDGRE